MIRHALQFILLISALPMTAVAQAQGSYPQRPIRIVVPVPPGGILDVVTRLLGQKVTEQTGHTVIVDNRSGGLTNVGSEMVARSAGDGHTLLSQTLPMVVNPALFVKMPYRYDRDLVAVSQIVTSPYLLVVHPSVPAKSVRELIVVARAQPGKISYATSGTGSNLHMAVALFNTMTGTQMLHIPYKGGGPALGAVVGGEADLSVLSATAVMPHVSSGRLRALAITSTKRMPALQQFPTIAESGVPGYEFGSWVGILAPSSTPTALVNDINAMLVKATRSPDLAARFSKDATLAVGSTPAQFADFIKAEAARWSKVVRESNMKVDT